MLASLMAIQTMGRKGASQGCHERRAAARADLDESCGTMDCLFRERQPPPDLIDNVELLLKSQLRTIRRKCMVASALMSATLSKQSEAIL